MATVLLEDLMILWLKDLLEGQKDPGIVRVSVIMIFTIMINMQVKKRIIIMALFLSVRMMKSTQIT